VAVLAEVGSDDLADGHACFSPGTRLRSNHARVRLQALQVTRA
jgi:hypothetical protein